MLELTEQMQTATQESAELKKYGLTFSYKSPLDYAGFDDTTDIIQIFKPVTSSTLSPTILIIQNILYPVLLTVYEKVTGMITDDMPPAKTSRGTPSRFAPALTSRQKIETLPYRSN
jgi:hypothetical protein